MWLLLLIIQVNTLEINITNCDYCHRQLCIVFFQGTVLSGNVKELFVNNTNCHCNNLTCGDYCEKKYYSKDQIVSCINSNNFMCFAAEYVDASKTNNMNMLFKAIIALGVLSLLSILLLIKAACYKRPQVNFEHDFDLETTSDRREDCHRRFRCSMLCMSIVLCMTECIIIIVFFSLYNKLSYEAENIVDEMHCL